MQHYTIEPREGMDVTTTPTNSMLASDKAKAKEAELETDLDQKPHLFDDGHIYDEPSRCFRERAPLPLPSDYKNVRTHLDAPPSYSSTVRFLQPAPLANSTMLDSFLSNGVTNELHETSDYSELDTSAMQRLEYGNIGHHSGSSEDSPLHDVPGPIDYTNIVSCPADPNHYAEMPGVAPTTSPASEHSRVQPNGDIKGDLAKSRPVLGGRAQAYEIPAKRQSDYQPLLPGERAVSGEYAQASPRHLHSVYDVPRTSTQSREPPSQPAGEETGHASAVVAGDKEEYMNATPQALSDMQDYVEMSSVPREK